MAKTREEVILEIIRILLSRLPEIKAAAVIDSDGLPIASEMSASPEEKDEADDKWEILGAMSASMMWVSERTMEELGMGDFQEIYIKGSEGATLMTGCGPNGMLIVTAKKKAKLGLVLLDIKRAASEIAKII